jgi:DNA-directed RNA polymerase sigma subunit (sigma70/sigma32)
VNRDKVTELLKNYRSYKYAVKNGESEALNFGFRIIPFVNSDRTITVNQWDFERYSRIVSMIDGAVREVLSDDEQKVIEYKYLERNTLYIHQIADKFHMSERKVTYLHKKALNSLANALAFVEVPDIHNIDEYLDNAPMLAVSGLHRSDRISASRI